jgi:hypothetical protein
MRSANMYSRPTPAYSVPSINCQYNESLETNLALREGKMPLAIYLNDT